MVVVAVAGAVLVATTSASRRTQHSTDLESAPAYRLHSGAGPVEVVAGPTARLDYRASWLIGGPRLRQGPPAAVPTPAAAGDGGGPDLLPAIDLVIDCPGRWPCRASSLLQVPAGSGLEATTDGGPVTIGAVDGPVVVSTVADDDILLGPVSGPVFARTERGAVIGTSLAASVVEVVTEGGPVELHFVVRPRRVAVSSGPSPVIIELPPGRYAVSVEGSRTATIGVDHDERADSRISVVGPGTVRISTTPDQTS